MKNLPLILLISLLTLSCFGESYPPGDPIAKDEVYGKYWADFDVGEEYIELREDSVYVHYFKGKDGVEYKESEKWRFYEEKGGYYVVVFSNFVCRYRLSTFSYSQSQGVLNTNPRDWGAYIKKFNNKLRIERDPVDKQFYIREEIPVTQDSIRPSD